MIKWNRIRVFTETENIIANAIIMKKKTKMFPESP